MTEALGNQPDQPIDPEQTEQEWPVEFHDKLHRNPGELREHRENTELRWKNHDLEHEKEDKQAEIDELNAKNQELKDQAERDPLTGLKNRRMFDQRLDELISEGRTNAAVIFIDLDGFKDINDTHGHGKGDSVLRRVAHALAGTVRDGDEVYRPGGDEFIVLIPELIHKEEETSEFTKEELGNKLAERFRFATKLASKQESVVGTASVGVAMLEPGDTPEMVTKRADEAMYLDKIDKEERLSKLR